MKLRLVILLVALAAIFASEASAALKLETKTRAGVNTSGRGATGPCGFDAYYSGASDLLLFCNGSTGYAKAKYDFYLPRTLYGTPSMKVYGDKLCCSDSVVKRTLVKVSARHYRIVVKVTKPTRFDVRSVSLSYYVRS